MTKLSEIKSFDLGGALPNSFWERLACKIERCETFHWFMFVASVKNYKGEIIDWVISESIGKGVSIDRLKNINGFVYRVRKLETENIDPLWIYEQHSKSGELPYSVAAGVDTALWWIIRHYLHIAIKFPRYWLKRARGIPVQLSFVKHPGINCISWVTKLALAKGVLLVPNTEPALETTLENSSALRNLGLIEY